MDVSSIYLHNNQHITLEGIQSRLKVLGIENSSQILKQYNNNNNNNNNNFKNNISHFIDNLDIDNKEKKYLKTISPFNYTGLYKL